MNRNHFFSLLGFLIILIVIFSFFSPWFLSFQNFSNILVASSTIGILGFGAAFIIASAGLDLSVGSVMALSGVAGVTFAAVWGLDWYFILISVLAVGMIVGSLNGFLIARFHIPAFIVTLGMLSIARGLALIVVDGRPVYGLDESLVFIGQGTVLGIPMPIILFVLTIIVMHGLLRQTRFGHITLCLGDNEEAVQKAGVMIQNHKIKLYALSGFLAGFAGLLFMGRINSADPAIGMGYELTAITAALLGGTNLFGGRTSIMGVTVGALIMGVLQNGLNLLAVPPYYQQVAIGLILILAVSFDYIQKRKKLS